MLGYLWFRRAADSAGADVERPPENQRDRKSRQHQNYDESRHPRGQGQSGEDGGGKLNDQPADNTIAGRDAIDLAPSQFAKESIETGRLK